MHRLTSLEERGERATKCGGRKGGREKERKSGRKHERPFADDCECPPPLKARALPLHPTVHVPNLSVSGESAHVH